MGQPFFQKMVSQLTVRHTGGSILSGYSLFRYEWKLLGETVVELCDPCHQARQKKTRVPYGISFAVTAVVFPVLSVRLLGQSSEAIWFVAIISGIGFGFAFASSISAIRSPYVLIRRLAKTKIIEERGRIPNLALWAPDEAKRI